MNSVVEQGTGSPNLVRSSMKRKSFNRECSRGWFRPAILAAAWFVVATASAYGFDIVVEGEAQARLIIPDEPLKTERYAAEELRHHIQKASGAELEIVAESEAADDGFNRIYVGRTAAVAAAGLASEALEEHGYAARLADGAMFFVGDERTDRDYDPLSAYNSPFIAGTLPGVYEFLEEHMGVRWPWPGELGEVVPQQATIRVEEWDRSGSPRFVLTAWATRRNFDHWSDPEVGVAFNQAEYQWMKRLGFAMVRDIRPAHSFQDYWKRYGESNPEFFSLLPNGKRQPLIGDQSGSLITLCVAESALTDQIVTNWREAGRRDSISIGENDTPGMCTCEKCRAWDAPDWRFYTSAYWAGGQTPSRFTRFTAEAGLAGDSAAWGGVFRPDNAPSLSNRYVRFYEQVYDRVSAENPDVIVGGFAYANTWRAPKGDIRLPKGVLISYVPPLWYPYTQRMSEEMRAEWDGWRATGATMMFRPNLTLAGHAFPIDYARPVIGDLHYLIETGSIGMVFDSLVGSFAVQGPTLYALARAAHRTDLSEQQILDEYYAAFGPAAAEVEDYFNHWQDVSNQLDEEQINLYYFEENGAGSFRNWVMLADRIFTPGVMQEGRKRLEAAHEAAAGDETATARVAYLDKGLTHAELVLDALHAHKADPDDAAYDATLKQAIHRLYDYRQQVEGDMVANMGYLTLQEPAKWREIAADRGERTTQTGE